MTRRKVTGSMLILLILTVVGLFSIGPKLSSSGSSSVAIRAATLSRQAIKQMPILERPSRPGHVYGNAVRRRYSRQVHRG